MPSSAEHDRSLERAMNESLKAYGAGDEEFFNYLTDDVRVYSLDSSEPIIGRKEFKKRFGKAFSVRKEVEKTGQDIRMVGDQAVLSQTLLISTEGVSLPIRQTVIWEGGRDKWRMSHIHNARAGQPVAVGSLPDSPEGIRVLNERIATAAAVVGVAQ